MAGGVALRIAIELVHVPSKVRLVRATPLPSDTLTILQIAAGDRAVINASAVAIERMPEVVEDAAAFFIEQILFCAEADSYRVLGASPEATSLELRRNMALLLRWVHPDLDRDGSRATFAVRVSRAWDNVKTLERRQAYDAKYISSQTPSSMSAPKSGKGYQRTTLTSRPDTMSRVGGSNKLQRYPVRLGLEWDLQSPIREGFWRRAFAFLFLRS